MVLCPDVQWKDNQKTGNLTQSEQWAGEPRCCAGSKRPLARVWASEKASCRSGREQGREEGRGREVLLPQPAPWDVARPRGRLASENRGSVLLALALVISASVHTFWPCSPWPVFMAQSLLKG